MNGRQQTQPRDVIKAISVGSNIILTFAMAVIIWQGERVLDRTDEHEQRLTKIEASRYTAQDAVEDRRIIAEQMTAMQKAFPPAWLAEDLQDLKADMRALRKEISELRKGGI